MESKTYDAHRLIPGREGGLYELGNVICLCKDCHFKMEGISAQMVYESKPYGLDIGRVLSCKWFESHSINI